MAIKVTNRRPGAANATTTATTGVSTDTLLAQFDTKYGQGSLKRLGDKSALKVEVIPTGIYTFDRVVLGAGGVPKGRVIEVFGPESSGKTTITLQIIAAAQAAGGQAAFVDAEHALDPAWASRLGVDTDALFVTQPDYGEQALSMVLDMVESKQFAVVVVDSVAALVPKAELEGEMGDSHMGLQARLMSQALRKLTGAVSKSHTIVIFINQIRDKIGVMFGSPETTTGGKALKFYASVRLDIRRIGQEKDGDTIIGSTTKIKAVKNKVAAPFRETVVKLLYDRGFDKVSDVLGVAVAEGVVDKAGSWMSYNGERLGQGENRVRDFLTENPEIFQAIYDKTVAAQMAEKAVTA